jgi:hypothetical protein
MACEKMCERETNGLIIWGQVVKEGLGGGEGQVVQGRFGDERSQ